MGRPAKPADERRVPLSVRVPAALLDEFDGLAAARHLTRTQAVERLMRGVTDGPKMAAAPKVAPRPAVERSRDVAPRFKS